MALQIGHDIVPDRARSRNARYFPHAVAAAIAHPDADGIAPRPTHAPVVAHVLAGARLDGGPEGRGQRAVETERTGEIGRASGRERGGQYVERSVGAGSLKKKKENT